MSEESTTDTGEPRPCLLFVDDEPGFADLARLALSGRFDVQASTSATEALRLGENPSVRLVLTDYQMDELHGVDLIRRLRERRPELPCILFSGHITREEWAAAHNAGCRHVLPKPLALSTVISLCEALLAPPDAPLIPEKSRDLLESIPWRGSLGRGLRALAGHLLEGRSPILIQTPPGGFPLEFLLGLLPSLQPYPAPDAPPPPRPLFTALGGLDLAAQTKIAQLLPARRGSPWLFSAEASPDDLLDRGLLAESLYFRFGPASLILPAPSESPDDTLHLCAWWLTGLAPASALDDDARDWLRTQLDLWDWATLLALLREAAGHHSDRPLGTASLQQASLAISLGSDLGDLQRYPEFADHFTRQLHTAWEALSAPSAP
jgi:CheY-like chemotaxis protein